MASLDWTLLTSGLDAANTARGVTSGITPPVGGGSFIYGFNTLTNATGVVGSYVNLVNFAPMAKGGSIRGALQRGVGGGKTNFAPFLFIGLGGNDVTDLGYMLGLGDADPHHIVLRKGALSDGLPDVAPGTSGVLRRSSDTFVEATWLHLRLDMIANLNGDVILQVFRNTGSVATPTWIAVPGMADFVDDALGVNSGSAPFTSGYVGFGFRTSDVTRRSYVDHLEAFRQL